MRVESWSAQITSSPGKKFVIPAKAGIQITEYSG